MTRSLEQMCYTNEGKDSYITLKDLVKYLKENNLRTDLNNDFDIGWNHNNETFIEKIDEILKERKELP